jgi:hypothetical protein
VSVRVLTMTHSSVIPDRRARIVGLHVGGHRNPAIPFAAAPSTGH